MFCFPSFLVPNSFHLLTVVVEENLFSLNTFHPKAQTNKILLKRNIICMHI